MALNLVLGASLLLMSYLSAGIANPYFVKASSPSGTYVYVGLAGDPLWLDAWTAWIVGSSLVINGQKVQPGEGLFVGPYFPGLYPILQRKSPLWEIHFVFPAAESRQREMIGELRQKNVNWVILADYALDGRDDLRFRNTHHLVWMHFFDEFEIMEASGLPPNFQLFHRRTIAQRPTP